ncbi:GntP family gluconate:H+ symporter [Xanthomonas sacchari]|uniref:GntP family permease n=1 Tax=unclassified Xanthomonas TaxID=2643310 RepID=UPI00136A8C7E|nr:MULTISPECIES: gluconate:H+ symporter [unclassified Xanthomonas]MBB6367679.1 GntP family gluconate:H+ symporter [Xanthomonas sp. F10]MXV31320.1 gluconate transporter [Xanthomonas sp. LMG 8989]
MSSNDLFLLFTALFSVIALVLLIVARPKLHPLLALLLVSLVAGLVVGMPMDALLHAVATGAGKTLGAVGLVVALGAMLGKLLAQAGVTDTLANAILRRASPRALPWAMAGVAFIVGIPMFFEVGLVILLPLIFGVARKLQADRQVNGSAYAYVGVPVIAALAAMHGMVPPHPGPLTAIATLGTSVGATMLYGFIAAIPAIVLAGPLYGRYIARHIQAEPDAALLAQYASADAADGGASAPRTPPAFGLGVLAALAPALLMLCHAVAEMLLRKDSAVLHATAFVGHPIVAMLLGVLFAQVALRPGTPAALRKTLGDSVKPVAGVLLIIAGGGAFQQVLTDAHVGDAIVHMSQQLALSPLLLGWLISMLLSVSTGSATVGVVGAAGLLAPLGSAEPTLNLPLLALSIGCGSLFFNYANHAGFWLVKESFGMSMGEATKTISVVQSIVALVGLGMVLLLNLLPPLA